MIILKGKVSTEGESVYAYLLFNPTLLELDGQKTGTGKYTFTSNIGLLNSGIPPKWYLADNVGTKYVVSQLNRTKFEIQVYGADGAESDTQLSNVEFEIDL